MYQEAINSLKDLLSKFELAYSIEILRDGSINLFVLEDIDSDQTELHDFDNVLSMVEWMEKNLKKS